MYEGIEIIVCDDHPLITEGLASFIHRKENMIIQATASTISELREVLKETSADILLLDISLPDGSGMDMCAEVKKLYPQMKILGLSNFDERSIILRMINNGASGYLLKSTPIAEIERAIKHIYDGGIYFGKETQNILNSMTDKETIVIPPLTQREKEVLRFLADGMTSPQIAEKMFISPTTVDSHRKNLMQKFEVGKTVNLIKRAKEAGYI